MNIIINDHNVPRIEALIAEAEGRATTRTLDIEDIKYIVEELDRYMYAHGISKASAEGTTVCYNPNGQKFANAYKYIPYSTQVKLLYHNKKWRLTDVSRDVCKQRTIWVNWTDAAKANLLDSASRLK